MVTILELTNGELKPLKPKPKITAYKTVPGKKTGPVLPPSPARILGPTAPEVVRMLPEEQAQYDEIIRKVNLELSLGIRHFCFEMNERQATQLDDDLTAAGWQWHGSTYFETGLPGIVRVRRYLSRKANR